jgi:hypothetical protein
MALLGEDPKKAIGLALFHEFTNERFDLLLIIENRLCLDNDNLDFVGCGRKCQPTGDANCNHQAS